MKMTEKELQRASRLTKAAFFFGAASTILINLAHADSGWGPKLTSLIAPISILFVVEIILILPNPDKLSGKIAKFGGAGFIGLAALSISYFHTAQLLISYNEDPLISWITPIVPDGMMVLASVAMVYVTRMKDQQAAEMQIAASKNAEKERKATERKATAAKRGPSPAQKLQEEARNFIRVENIAGNEVTAKIVAAQFSKSETWGRERIAEIKKESSEKEIVAIIQN